MGAIFRRFYSTPALFTILLSGSISFAQSQHTPWEKALFDDKDSYKVAYKHFQKGESLYKQGIYSQALTEYLPAQKFNLNNAEVNMKIGQCYLYSSTKLEAKPYLEKALALDERINISIHLLLGKAYHLEMDWVRAIEHYEKFVNLASQQDAERIALARKRIEECKYGQTMVKSPLDIKIEALPAPVNTEFAEYHPLISADEGVMYFTSRRASTTGGNRDVNYDIYYEDIYKTSEKDGVWEAPVGIGPTVNTNFHDATVGLSADGQQLFIYKDEAGDGNIYYCELDGNEWSAPVKLNENINSEYTETTACFSFDGMTIYFISDRPGGFGNNDIYVSKKDDNDEWGPAKNLGASINTLYNEDAVYMHPDGKTLYFSSEGHSTMGGYDIFKSVYNEQSGSWSTPENMGYPINSADDDVFFVLSASGERGYYSSIKANGMGEKDIYMITFPSEEKKPELTLVKGAIIDTKSGLPIYAQIEVIDNEKNEVIAKVNSNKLTGEYLFSLPSGRDYGITVTADGYFFHSENINIPASTPYFEMFQDISLGEIGVGESIVLDFIYFETNETTLSSQSLVELERVLDFMRSNPNLKIEISGHTDNVGSEAYNIKLSTKRAQAVVDWLASKNSERSKMTSRGYGFSKPVESNDTEEGRAKNRRTEFKVLEYKASSHKAKGNNVPKKAEVKSKPAEEPISEPAPVVEPEPTPQAMPEPEQIISVPVAIAENTAEPISKPEPDPEPEATQIFSVPSMVAGADPEPTPEPSPAPEKMISKPAPVEEPPSEPAPSGLREFSSSKPNFYTSNQIDVDPALPDGVMYRVQIGSFSKLPTGAKLNGLYPVTAMKLDNGLFRCFVGEFRTYKEAKTAQKVIRSSGFSDAFLIAFNNGKRTTVSKAINLE